MLKEEANEIEIGDVEHYIGEKDQTFSHKELVMRAMRKCLEAGCREMMAGWFNQKMDKRGNVAMIYIEDTRKVFIESIETARMFMSCDMDKKAKDEIKKIEENLEKKFKELCGDEEKDWESAPNAVEQHRWKQGIFFRKEHLSTAFPYYQEYINEEVKAYRKIFEELTNLTRRLDFYKEEEFEA